MFNDPGKTTEAIRELVKPLALIDDELKANLLIKNISKKFNLREMLLENELDKIKSGLNKQKAVEIERELKKVEQKEKLVLKTDKELSAELINLEKELIKLLLEGENHIIEFISRHIKPDEYRVPIHCEITELIYTAFVNGEKVTPGSLIDKLKNEDQKLYIRELTFEKYQISKNWEEINPSMSNDRILRKYSVDAVRKFKLRQVEEKISGLNDNLLNVNDENKKLELLNEIKSLSREKQLIKEDIGDDV